MVQNKKNYWICAVPAVFMSAVTSSYILQAPEGLKLPASVSNCAGVVFALILFVIFCRYTRKQAE